VGIPDCILLKPGRLTAEEFEIMKKHVVFGVEALRSRESGGCSLSFIRTAMEIAATHHEKFNGSGYPNNLAGKDIPLSGRLMAIIDVYDALVSERVYKAAYSHEEAMELIAQEKGRHFDPDIVDAFFEIQADIKKIADTFIPHRP
jgi:putative two-component system response regulator